MGKKDKEKKKKERKKEEDEKENSSGNGTAGTYADGHPLEEIQYLEAKLILKPDRFTSVESFRDFGKLVKKTAKNEEVGFVPDVEAGLCPNIREILFMDTPDFRLYSTCGPLRELDSTRTHKCVNTEFCKNQSYLLAATRSGPSHR